MALYCAYDDCAVSACCDYCQYFRFNGDAEGAYVDDGRCVHPAHPMRADPTSCCADFHCERRPDVDPALAQAHRAANRRPAAPEE